MPAASLRARASVQGSPAQPSVAWRTPGWRRERERGGERERERGGERGRGREGEVLNRVGYSGHPYGATSPCHCCASLPHGDTGGGVID